MRQRATVWLLVAIAVGQVGAPAVALAKTTNGRPSAGAAVTSTGSAVTKTTSAVTTTAATTTAASSAASTATAPAPVPTTGPLSGGVSPLGPVSTTSSTTAPTVINLSSTTSGSSGLSGTSAIVIAIGAFVVLAGISYFIWRDARRRAPVATRSGAGSGDDGRNRPGSKAPPKARKLSAAERRRRKRGRAKR